MKAYDAVALEDWLYLCPAVSLRFARELRKMPPVGVRCTEQLWEEYAKQFSPDLTPEVLLADRAAQANTILSQMRAGRGIHLWQADSTEEVIAFIVAAIRKAEPQVRRFIEDRTLIVDNIDAARQLAHTNNLILLLRPDSVQAAGMLSQRGLVIVPVGRDNPTAGNAVLLEQQTLEGLTKGIMSMGLSEEESRRHALNCGRSVTILARQISSAVAQVPYWAGNHNLIPALLAGSWDAQSEQDQKAIAALAGANEYSEYENQVVPYLTKADSPLVKEGEVWQVRAPVDAFAYLGRLVSRKDFDRLRSVAEIVFSETDTSLELPENERLHAEIYGKTLRHSSWLRDGLARTLRLIAVRHGPLGLTNTGTVPNVFVDRLIAELPDLATSYVRIASLHSELPILMEAAPRPLLAALEQMLGGGGKALVPIFQDKDPFLSRSPHTGLLWGLEALAWDPAYLADATLVLAKLVRIDPGGKLTNRPLNSLREIFLSWHPGTNATLVQRMAALDQIIITEPEVGWKLLIELLPGFHEVSFPTAKPRYVEAGASQREPITEGIRIDARRGIVERALSLARIAPRRWIQLIKELSNFDKEQRTSAAGLLEDAVLKMSSEDRTLIWSALRSFVAGHKAFPTAEWAMKETDLEPFQRLTTALEPPDTLTRILWLFNDWNPAIPEQESHNFDLAEKTRERTVAKLFETGGTKIILDLAQMASHPELVGAACGRVIGNVETFASLVDNAMGKSDPLALFASVLSAEAERRFGQAWHSHIVSLKEQHRWTDEQVANLILNWTDERSTWDFAASLGPSVTRSYWQCKRPWIPRGLSPEDSEIAAHRYIDAGRAIAAIQAFGLDVSALSAETVFKMLDVGISELNANKQHITSTFVFELEQIFDSLQRRERVPIFEIAKREYAYLPLFGYHKRQLALHRVMSEDPVFYASLIHDAFKPRHQEVPEPTEDQRTTAKAAYKILSEFTILPGMHNGHIDPDALSSWVDAVRSVAKKDDRSEIADDFMDAC